MRDIKFRGYFTGDKKWIYGCIFPESLIKDPDYLSKYWIATGHEDEAFPVEEETIGQYTGLKDKNKKEIYEEDIVDGVLYKDYTEHKGLIVYDYSGYRIVTKEKSLSLDLAHLLTVIGNVHENPELLEGLK